MTPVSHEEDEKISRIEWFVWISSDAFGCIIDITNDAHASKRGRAACEDDFVDGMRSDDEE
jgi:hypothetical protein